MIDSTIIRAPHCAAGAKGGTQSQDLGRSRGGFSTKIHLRSNRDGLPIGCARAVPCASGLCTAGTASAAAWVLMLLLFAAGVMNLLWVAALSALVLLQKVLLGGQLISAVTGCGMAVIGPAFLLRQLIDSRRGG